MIELLLPGKAQITYLQIFVQKFQAHKCHREQRGIAEQGTSKKTGPIEVWKL